MELSKRLTKVASLVTEGASVADIGTDHGYIPIYLIENNIAAMIAAGMGGGLVIKILREGKPVVDTLKSCILQPQSEIHRVRRYVAENQMKIVDEDMVEEDGKFYPIMKVEHGSSAPYTECEYLYGKCLLEGKHPVLKKYLDREMGIRESILGQLSRRKGSESAAKRMEEVREEIVMLREALEYFDR